MNDSSTELFQRLKPLCVSLSSVSLREPVSALPDLQALCRALEDADRSHITQSLANYIFFPLKPLLRPGTAESISSHVFDIIRWLLRTPWLVKGDEMVSQLTILLTTSLARANSEEFSCSLLRTFDTLIDVSGLYINVVHARPSLAHIITLLLEHNSSPANHVLALQVLSNLYEKLQGDNAASFLPGTVSFLAKLLLKPNQKSRLIIGGLRVIRSVVSASFDRTTTSIRTSEWKNATNSQLILALGPVLSKLITTEYEAVRKAGTELCNTVLERTDAPASSFVEYMLQADVESIPACYGPEISKIMESYIDATTRILQGVDEQRKINMLHTMERSMLCLSSTSRQLLSFRLVSQLLDSIHFTKTDQMISQFSDSAEPPPEPTVDYLSANSRDSLIRLLRVCEFTESLPLETPEQFWISQKLGLQTYSHAILQLSTQTDLSLQSIISESYRLGIFYRPELMNVLYQILALPQPSLYTLSEISKACQYSDVQTMIVDNSDYIVNSLNLAFITLDVSPRTPKILAIVIQLAPAMVELIDDVIDTFFDVLDDYHGYLGVVEGIFAGLSGVITAVARQPPKSSFATAIEQSASPAMSPDASFEERFESVKDGETSSREIPDEEVKKESKSYQIVLQIIEKAQLFLSHGGDSVKLHVLELMHAGLPVIATNENKFLPLVHLIWPQLTRRFADSNPYIVASTLRVVARTITFAGSFMRMRIKSDVTPFIADLLHPTKDKRGNLLHERRTWEGTGRRKVAEGIQEVLKAIVEDGGLQGLEQSKVLAYVEELAGRSEVLRKVLENERSRPTDDFVSC